MTNPLLTELSPRARYARREAFKWLALKLRKSEKERGKKYSKNVRRRLALELDLDIMMKVMEENENKPYCSY